MVYDLNQWLQPADNLFTNSAQFSGVLANSGQSIGFLLMAFFAILLILFVMVAFKKMVGSWLR